MSVNLWEIRLTLFITHISSFNNNLNYLNYYLNQ